MTLLSSNGVHDRGQAMAMSSATRSAEEILAEIETTQAKLRSLHFELLTVSSQAEVGVSQVASAGQHPLALKDYIRYGRQMIVSEMGLPAQLSLKQASVLVVGAGGLGCPALLYLVRAGVGHISIVDHDAVELSNLHRQVLHTEFTIGMNKAESARNSLLAGNPSTRIEAYPIPFVTEKMSSPSLHGLHRSKECLPDLSQFSLVLDCTDNPTSRYLISDACAAHAIPLVSGAAIRTEGQLSVWNLPSTGSDSRVRGPCYRCVFPQVNELRAERCADEGVLGPAVGVIGVLMAWEAIRLLIGKHDLEPKLILVPSFRTIKLRKAKIGCKGCSLASRAAFIERIESRPLPKPSVTGDAPFQTGCTSTACSMMALAEPSVRRITVKDLISGARSLAEFRLIDVRPKTQFGICALPNSFNIPITEVLQNPLEIVNRLNPLPSEQDWSSQKAWLLLCRRGNDSQLAAEAFRGVVPETAELFDLEGGLEAYAAHVDRNFPVY